MTFFLKLPLAQKIIVVFIKILSCLKPFVTLLFIKIIGLVWHKKRNKLQSVVLKNLEHCLPDSNVETLQSRSYNKVLQTASLLPHTWVGSKKSFYKRVEAVQGLESIHSDIAQKKKTVVLFPHIGNWEFACQHLIRSMPQVTVHSLARFKGDWDELLCYCRNYHIPNSIIHPAASSGVIAIYRALQRAEPILMAPDQVPESEKAGCYAPFFGVDTLSSQLLSKLLQKQPKTCVYACFAIYIQSKYHMFYLPITNAKLFEADLQSSVAALNSEIEGFVRRWPEDFLWTYKRFKNSIPPFRY